MSIDAYMSDTDSAKRPYSAPTAKPTNNKSNTGIYTAFVKDNKTLPQFNYKKIKAVKIKLRVS